MRIDERIAYDGVQPRVFEHVHILGLSYFVGNVVDGNGFFLLVPLFFRRFALGHNAQKLVEIFIFAV